MTADLAEARNADRFGAQFVSRETATRLLELKDLIAEWNSTVQLVSGGDVHHLDRRHIANSLCLLPPLRRLRPRSILDVGSGGGFPGLVVAIATGLCVHLVESDLRKSAFLREAARRLQVQAVVHAQRIETVGLKADVVTARAFAPLHKMWPVAALRLTPQGRGLFLAGHSVAHHAKSIGCPGLIWSFQDGIVFEVANR